MIINTKGGCGKSTIATNLAAAYAQRGEPAVLLDLDPQQSSIDWLELRPKNVPKIRGLSSDIKHLMMPHTKGTMIIDTPGSIQGKELKTYVKNAHTILIPVLPSPLDMRATAKFVEALLLMGRISKNKTRIAVVANRVQKQTRIYQGLKRFLNSLGIPFIAVLRESQNYIRAAEQGTSIFEARPSRVKDDLKQWKPLLRWLDSEASYPKKG